ncbi:MAG: GH92 family glycosyl hydrolase [Prevotella sp.]|nr:GH92 family glycosyl hydrolase [Prevotella sp.]
MRKTLLTFLCLLMALLADAQVWQYVDPRIGSVGVGRTFLGPCMPFGMVKPGPDCGVLPNAGWAPMPEAVLGFSQTHVSGTGGGQKYGNVLIQPYVNAPSVFDTSLGWPTIPQRRINEDISLGYYATTYENGIRTEITTAERCSFYRIHYPPDGVSHLSPLTSRLLIDVTHFLGKDTTPDLRERQQFVGSNFRVVDNHEVQGSTSVRGGWNNGDAYTVFFSLLTDVPFTAEGNNLCFADTLVNVKIGISYVSTSQARRNIPDRSFDDQLLTLRNTWEKSLSPVQIGGTEQQKRMFYTALYHTMLMPVEKESLLQGAREKGQGARNYSLGTENKGLAPYYDDYYAIWDTYRTSSPLLTLLCPDREIDIVNSLLNIYKHDGYLPDARSGDCNGRTQGGSNAEVVIADAFVKGLGRDSRNEERGTRDEKTIDYTLALEAMLHDAEADPGPDHEKHGRGGLEVYKRLGYIPYGVPRAGTRTVEYAFCDWCIAQVAGGLGVDSLYIKYLNRSRNWRNLWRTDYEYDGMRGFIMPKDAQGRWMDNVPWGQSRVFHPTIPYTPTTKVAPWYLPWWNTFFYEATSEEYSLSVPHDVEGLIDACGGPEAFRERLDLFFAKGYYNVQNEPSFLTPCLYHWIGRPDLSSERIHQIVNDHYTDLPDGLPGNDDSGAMSSWLAFHMMGLYPNAGTDYYLLNVPILDEYTFQLANGRQLHVRRVGEGDGFKSVSLNGKRLKDARITHSQLIKGGELVFETKKEKVKTLRFMVPPVIRCGEQKPLQPFASYSLHFTLNRQFRTWPLSLAWDGDTLMLTCKETLYRIARSEVEHAKTFCWLSPQTDGTIHDNVSGTFCFISFDALRSLQSTGSFVYDGITWRLIDKAERTTADGTTTTICHVRADVDGTDMWISMDGGLPWVVEMRNNPLGIDWKLLP